MSNKYAQMKIEGNIFSNKSFGYINNKKVVVKAGIKGQVVEVKIGKKRREYYEARIERVIEKSELETEIACPHKEDCGGCKFQSLTYENELKLKENMYLNIFEKEAMDFSVFEGIEKAPSIYSYRNKMEYTFGDEYKGGPLQLGMNKKGKFHEVVEVTSCNIVHRDFTIILEEVLKYFQKKDEKKFNKINHEGFLRHLVIRKSLTHGDLLINIVTSTQSKLDNDFVDYLLSIKNLEGKITGILHTENDSMGDVVQVDNLKVLYGKDYLIETILGLDFKLSPFSFFQTNTFGAEKLYSIVRDFVGEEKNDIVFDLYSGTGTIAQILSPLANKIYGIELIEEAVEMARENAKLNKLDNVEFIAGDVMTEVDKLNYNPDLIILDPPRMGINPKAIDKIIDFNPKRFVYVSCNPVTLLKDLKVFIERGYKIERMKGMDMFPRTPHCETVVKLKRI